jgi:pimeloyl-ACP methyl ester carboxylesterase
MLTRRFVLGALGVAGGATLAGGAATRAAYGSARAAAEARLAEGSALLPSRFGPVEFADVGSGDPLLMIHGTGGGFDQGVAFCRRLIDGGRRVIAPSRFGYLRSAFPDDPSSANQADAFADLLDGLGIDRLPVLGGSAGALSAIEFAVRHPDRCTGLVAVVPATYAPDRPPAEPPGPVMAAMVDHILHSDFLFWLALVGAERAMIGTLLATDPALVDRASPEEQARIRRILWDIFPVSVRAEGLLNDARLAGDPAPSALERITAPVLAISLEDDRFGTRYGARHLAASVPGARLVMYPDGGHVWVGRDAELFGEIARFLDSI